MMGFSMKESILSYRIETSACVYVILGFLVDLN